MGLDPETIRTIAEQTKVLRPPKQALATFGVTSITYYLVTEPVYADLTGDTQETVVREGTVTAARPQIVTPNYLLNLFRGFEHGEEFASYLRATYGPDAPGLLYSYRNELVNTSVVSESMSTVARRLADQLDRDGVGRAVVIQGIDHYWDVSLMKFIHDLTVASLGENVRELGQRGLLGSDRGVPRAALARIEEMFTAVAAGEMDPTELRDELDRWGLFSQYEDRFLNLFRRR